MRKLVEEMYPNRCILYINDVLEIMGVHYSTLRRERLSGTFPPDIQVTDKKLDLGKICLSNILKTKRMGGSKNDHSYKKRQGR